MGAVSTFRDLDSWNWVSGMGGWGNGYMRHEGFMCAIDRLFEYEFILSEKMHHAPFQQGTSLVYYALSDKSRVATLSN